MPLTIRLRPRRLALEALPDEVAASLRHLPGFVWLDTAGCCPEVDRESALSIIAACPRRLLRGHISDVRPLERALASLTPPAPIDWGVPAGGLFGWIEYDGAYCFGLYDRTLIYRHGAREWLATGDLWREARPARRAGHPAESLRFAPSLSRDTYCRMVEQARDHIAAGEIYQVNLAHSFAAGWPLEADPFALYLRLRETSPAPMAAYLSLDRRHVLSSSPESFLKMSGHSIRTRPIKGTRPRYADAVADERSLRGLLTSPKERAELIMITDLMRNDLGMVSEFGSVAVTGLLQAERYEQVHHLVSTVQGVLRPAVSHAAALKACFPGGSITGAPKKRAIEIIRSLEPSPRGLYTGAIGFLGAGGESHFSIAIRTAIIEQGRISFHTGAGIVADSDPVTEWDETLQKAAGILSAAQ